MKTQVVVAAVIGAAAIGAGAAAIPALMGDAKSAASGTTTPAVSASVSTAPSASATTSHTSTASPTVTGPHSDPKSSTGIYCKRADMFDTTWLTMRYPGPTMEGGDVGAVQPVQRMLNYVTASDTCLRDDGVWSTELGTAIKAFQSSHGLEVVNQAGPKTFATLQAAVMTRAEAAGVRMYYTPNEEPMKITSVATARNAVPGAPEDFITFIGNDGAKAAAEAKRDCNGEGVDTVSTVDDSGFAMGGYTSCGGAELIWSNQSGQWKVILGSQAEWACGDLEKFHVPSRMYGALTQCLDGQYNRAYGTHLSGH